MLPALKLLAAADDKKAVSVDFAAVLKYMVEARASDVHLSPGFPPAIRVRGSITPLEDYEPLTSQDTREVVYAMLNDTQRKRFENDQQLDFAYSIPSVARFRVNVFFQRGSISAAFRHIPARSSASRRSGCRPCWPSSPASRAASCW